MFQMERIFFLVLLLLCCLKVKAQLRHPRDPCDTHTCTSNQICVAKNFRQAYCACPTGPATGYCKSASDDSCPAPHDKGICNKNNYNVECKKNSHCTGGKVCCLTFCGTRCMKKNSKPKPGNSGNSFLLFWLLQSLFKRPKCSQQCYQNACYSGQKKCYRHQYAKCKASCNGCVAHFFDKWEHDITRSCSCYHHILCPDSCRGKQCAGYTHKSSECRVSGCNGRCTYDFYDHYGNKLRCQHQVYPYPPIHHQQQQQHSGLNVPVHYGPQINQNLPQSQANVFPGGQYGTQFNQNPAANVYQGGNYGYHKSSRSGFFFLQTYKPCGKGNCATCTTDSTEK